MNRCNMELRQRYREDIHVILNIHISNLEKLDHNTSVGTQKKQSLAGKDYNFMRKMQKFSVGSLTDNSQA